MSPQQTVLIVDDSELIRVLIPERLKELGVRIVTAESGPDALARINEQHPDLVLLDVNMPGMTGFEVCRQLKNNPDTHDIPVIFLTGSDESTDKVRGFDLGAVDYVTKPFDPAELQARVRAALHTKTLMDMLTTEAQLDGLTGMHNRRYFDRRLTQELEAGRRYDRPVSLMMIDIDRFKHINDTFGHPKGDEILCHLARVLRRFCRSSDVACRYGGEEFAIILPETTGQEAFHCGQRLLEAVHHAPDLQGVVSLPITISIGTGCANTQEAMLSTTLIEATDRALYAAKQTGRDRVVSSCGQSASAQAA